MKKLLFSMLFLMGSHMQAAAHEDIFEEKRDEKGNVHLPQNFDHEDKRMAAILAIQQDKSDALDNLEELKKADPGVVERLFDYALRSSGEHNPIIVRALSKELQGKSRSKSSTLSFLDVAIISGNVEGVKVLLEQGVETHDCDAFDKYNKCSALKSAEGLLEKIRNEGDECKVKATQAQMGEIVVLLQKREGSKPQPPTIVKRLSRSLSQTITRRRSKTNETT